MSRSADLCVVPTVTFERIRSGDQDNPLVPGHLECGLLTRT